MAAPYFFAYQVYLYIHAFLYINLPYGHIAKGHDRITQNEDNYKS